jgi:hypothetical protein
MSPINPQNNMKKNKMLQRLDRIRLLRDDNTLDPVVYTVQAFAKVKNEHGKKEFFPVIYDNWQPVVVTKFERVP